MEKKGKKYSFRGTTGYLKKVPSQGYFQVKNVFIFLCSVYLTNILNLIDYPDYLSKPKKVAKRKLPAQRNTVVNKRKPNEKSADSLNMDNMPSDWEPELQSAGKEPFDPKRCVAPPSWYWTESKNNDLQVFRRKSA